MIKIMATRMVPWYLVGVYRLVPGSIRGSRPWPGSRGPSSSHMALDLMAQGENGWTAIRTSLIENYYDPYRDLSDWHIRKEPGRNIVRALRAIRER